MNIHAIFTGILVAALGLIFVDKYPKTFQASTYTQASAKKIASNFSKKTAEISAPKAKIEKQKSNIQLVQKVERPKATIMAAPVKQSEPQKISAVTSLNKKSYKTKLSLVEN